VITAIDGEVATVEIVVELTRRRWARRGLLVPRGQVMTTRTHYVSFWRLCMEN
jgi:hypothetical protein